MIDNPGGGVFNFEPRVKGARRRSPSNRRVRRQRGHGGAMGGMGRRALQPESWDEEPESGGDAAAPQGAAARLAGLEKAIDAEVIPRLVLARRSAPAETAPGGFEIGPDDVTAFALT